MATVILYTTSQDKVWRTVKSETPLDTAKELNRKHPRLILGIFEDPTGKTGECWFFFPDDL